MSDTGACLVCGRSAADLDVLTAEVARLTDDCAYLDEENKRLEAERDALYYTLLQISRTAVPEEQSTATRELRVVTLEAQKALERVLR